MDEAGNLLPPDVLSNLIEDLQEYSLNGDNARIEMYVMNGKLHTYWSAPVRKVGDKRKRRKERLVSINTQRSDS